LAFSQAQKIEQRKVNSCDVVVIGAGSVGVPTALACAEQGLNVLVIDEGASPGQGQNKAAIGGIRATHSDFSKILTCQRSLEIFSTWEERYGDPIHWLQGGYTFPVYRKEEELILRRMLPIQKMFGLEIDWVGPERIREILPGINPEGLRGGTHSPGDGSSSPLMAIAAFHRRAAERGAEFRFRESVTGLTRHGERTWEVKTSRGTYSCLWVVNAAGAYARDVAALGGVDLPVQPDCHEGGVTEPVATFFSSMIVDLRPAGASANFYYYQNALGHIMFCITPRPPILGIDLRSTSEFLPMLARRMLALHPRLRNCKVRRVWRGLYPMTPDGFPIVDEAEDAPGFIQAVGMCGQGFMLGPGIGELLARLLVGRLSQRDEKVLEGFSLSRCFEGEEKFK